MKTPRLPPSVWMTRWRSLPVVSRRRFVMGAALLLVVGCLALTYESLLCWFAYRFRVEDPPAKSDAIVFMLGSYDRSSKAADLYREGVAPIVLVSPTDDSWGEADGHRRVLTGKGVPAGAVRILPGSPARGTWDEALRVRDYVRSHPVRKVTVVTSAYHTARTRWAFRRALRGLGVEVRMAASDPHFTESNWYLYEDGIYYYFNEIIKNIYYRSVY